ncbi:hypothetical protein [Egbenema bharatensis]|uniref:hypothetical protein n=1 Tax=Egbenema bharatensis TaxID=3463334 RepID=UPI003A893C9D
MELQNFWVIYSAGILLGSSPIAFDQPLERPDRNCKLYWADLSAKLLANEWRAMTSPLKWTQSVFQSD